MRKWSSELPASPSTAGVDAWQKGSDPVAERRPMDASSHSPLILVIDDRPEEIRTIVDAMRADHMRVNIATEGRHGYERAQALQPDLILLDVRLPDLDGLAVCRLLKESPRTRETPIVFLSSSRADEERLAGLLQGSVDYVAKPYFTAEVLARIRIHLRLTARNGVAGAASEERLSHEEVILRAAMRFIQLHLADLPQLAVVAHKVGTHEKKLSSIFRQYTGGTVFSWVREQRLLQGRELLSGSRMNMQDIAEHVGFRSACNFTTAFRERMGITPSEFRRAAQKDGEAVGSEPVSGSSSW
jgi:DNA-binding response OmpR family regulator